MSQFDRENNEVIALVNANHRRSSICPTVGYIVSSEEAHNLAVRKVRDHKGTASVASLVFPALILFTVVAIAVVVLA
jgi:hypothetical protein